LIPLGGDEEGIELRVERWGGRLNDIFDGWVRGCTFLPSICMFRLLNVSGQTVLMKLSDLSEPSINADVGVESDRYKVLQCR